MSRERPTEQLRAVPDAQRGMKPHIDARKERQRNEIEALKGFSGAGFMGWLGATFSRGPLKRAPQFIRRSYESGIVDDLNDFYAARPRPWRPRSRDSCKPTFKERLKAQRRNAR
jgi:hypothetical protein